MTSRELRERLRVGQVSQPSHADRLRIFEVTRLAFDDATDEPELEQLGEVGLAIVQQAHRFEQPTRTRKGKTVPT